MVADDCIRVEVRLLSGLVCIDPLLEALIEIRSTTLTIEGISYNAIRIVTGILDNNIGIPGIACDPLKVKAEVCSLVP